MSYLDLFNVIQSDPSSGMTCCIPLLFIKHFQIDVEKHFVYFHCRTKSKGKAFTVLIFKYDKSEQ